MIGYPNEDVDEPEWLDHAALKFTGEHKPGDRFVYAFDPGDNWRHAGTVLDQNADPRDVWGDVPDRPVAIWGWGGSPTGADGGPGPTTAGSAGWPSASGRAGALPHD